jgi:hypothetical protein
VLSQRSASPGKESGREEEAFRVARYTNCCPTRSRSARFVTSENDIRDSMKRSWNGELWENVQQRLRDSAARTREPQTKAQPSPLAGKVFDETGEPLYAQGAVRAWTAISVLRITSTGKRFHNRGTTWMAGTGTGTGAGGRNCCAEHSGRQAGYS